MLLNCLHSVLSDDYWSHPMGEIDFCAESYVLSAVPCSNTIALVITGCGLFSFLSLFQSICCAKIDWETWRTQIAIFVVTWPFQLYSVKYVNSSFAVLYIRICWSRFWGRLPGGCLHLCSPVDLLELTQSRDFKCSWEFSLLRQSHLG